MAKDKPKPRIDRCSMALAILQYFMIDQDEQGEKIGLNTFYSKNYLQFQEKFSRSSFDRMWRESGVKNLHDINKNVINRSELKDQVIQLLCPHLDYLNEDCNKTIKECQQSDKEKERISNFKNCRRYLTDQEELHIVSVCQTLSNFGHPITKKGVMEIINRLMEKKHNAMQVDSVFHPVSVMFVEKVISRHKDLADMVTPDSIDPTRLDKVNIQTRDSNFAKLDSYTKVLVKMDRVEENVKGFDDIDDECKYNIDEVPMNCVKRAREKVFGKKKKKMKQRARRNRHNPKYRRTFEGDKKMNRHVSYMICSRADGAYCYPGDEKDGFEKEGAIPPYIIHKQASVKRTCSYNKTVKDVENEKLDKLYTTGLYNYEHDIEDNGDNDENVNVKNPCGFGCITTPGGSMQHDVFLDYAMHFVKYLPKSQGKDGKAVILILDGHKSRWTLGALEYLMENNVYPFFIPSHTSIITQPNDCAVNKQIHLHIINVTNEMSLILNQCSIHNLNIIFYKAWKRFIQEESDKFINNGENAATIAWRKCGLAPFNKHCDNWESELAKVEEYNKMMDEIQVQHSDTIEDEGEFKMYEVVPNNEFKDCPRCIFTSKNDEDLFYKNYESYRSGKGSIYRVAYLRAVKILGRWRSNNSKSNPQDHYEDKGDELAMELMKYVDVKDYVADTSIADREQKNFLAKSKKRAIHAITNMESVIDHIKMTYDKGHGDEKCTLSRKTDGKWKLTFIDESIVEFDDVDDIVNNDLIKIHNIYDKSRIEVRKLSNIQEYHEEQRCSMVARYHYETMKCDEYEKIKKMMTDQDTHLFTYEYFSDVISKIASPFATSVGGREAVIEPSFNTTDNSHKVVSPGCFVRDSVKEILTCIDDHERMTNLKVEAEMNKKRAASTKRKNTSSTTSCKKKNKTSGDDENNKSLQYDHVMGSSNETDESKYQTDLSTTNSEDKVGKVQDPEEEISKRTARTPGTKYGANGIWVQHHLYEVDKRNDLFEKQTEVKRIETFLKKAKKTLDEFNEMESSNENACFTAIQNGDFEPTMWYDWNNFDPKSSVHKKWFHILCRVVFPNAKVLSKDMDVKKKLFGEKPITHLNIMSAKHDLEKDVKKQKLRLKELTG